MNNGYVVVGIEPVGPEFFEYLKHALYPDVDPGEMFYANLVNMKFIGYVFNTCVQQALSGYCDQAEFYLNLLTLPDYSMFQGLFDNKTAIEKDAFARSFREFAMELRELICSSVHPKATDTIVPVNIAPTYVILTVEGEIDGFENR